MIEYWHTPPPAVTAGQLRALLAAVPDTAVVQLRIPSESPGQAGPATYDDYIVSSVEEGQATVGGADRYGTDMAAVILNGEWVAGTYYTEDDGERGRA